MDKDFFYCYAERNTLAVPHDFKYQNEKMCSAYEKLFVYSKFLDTGSGSGEGGGGVKNCLKTQRSF